MPRIQIFKAGKHTSSNGVVADYPVSRLEPAIANYNAETHISPVVAGHPSADDPALAWVKSLHLNGDIVEAEIDEVEPAFAEAVRTGRYKKVSASFFLPDSPSNPMPGQLYLRHVGILGAATPAVPGLKPLNFAAADEGIVQFDDGLLTNAGLFRSIREWIISKFSIEDADQAVPASEIDWLNTLNTIETAQDAAETAAETAAVGDDVAVSPDFAEQQATQTTQEASTGDERPATDTEAAADHSEANQSAAVEFAEREAALAAKEAALAAKEAALQQAECVQFCDALVGSGQLLPANKDTAEKLLASLYQSSGTVDFSDNSLNLADAFKQFLTALPKTVEFGEVAPDTSMPAAPTADFVAAPGYQVDSSRMSEYNRLAQIAKERGISIADAVLQQL